VKQRYKQKTRVVCTNNVNNPKSIPKLVSGKLHFRYKCVPKSSNANKMKSMVMSLNKGKKCVMTSSINAHRD